METIYLTGFNGVGKTVIGKLLASRKELKHLDTNLKIEYQENKKIETIINEKGIDYLKKLEKKIIKNDVEQGMIVSISADIPKDRDNAIAIKKSGKVIYLRANSETIYQNLKNDYDSRFELKNEFSILSIEKQIIEAKPYYEEIANYIIDIDNKSINTVFKEALAIYNYNNKVKCHIFIK